MQKKKIVLVLMLILFGGMQAGLWAGDTATFVDLGFSPDGNTYIFAQYGVRAPNMRAWADMFIVDVPRNNFVSGGRMNYIHDRPISGGQDGSGALYQLISRNTSIAERYNVNFSAQGKPLFIALDDRPPGESIEFRDFENNAHYRASLVTVVYETASGMSSSFHINLEKSTQGGARRSYTVGTPQLRRPDIETYRIRRVMVSPGGDSMIMVIEMKQREGDSFNIRYMVEAVRF